MALLLNQQMPQLSRHPSLWIGGPLMRDAAIQDHVIVQRASATQATPESPIGPTRRRRDAPSMLTEQQVAVLLVAADIARDSAGSKYRIGSRPTEFGVGDSGSGIQVPLEAGLPWAALHQDAIVVQLPDRTGALAGQPAAALLRRGR